VTARVVLTSRAVADAHRAALYTLLSSLQLLLQPIATTVAAVVAATIAQY